MVMILQRDLGVRYNPDRIDGPDFTDSRDLFIHGLITGHGGTCISIPVLYIAIGRRLGYPLHLVQAKAHLFVRWDDSNGERFNIEATNPKGFGYHSDDYYRTWPLPWSREDYAAGVFLTSLSHREELGAFFAVRGHCLEDNGLYTQAADAYESASLLHFRDPWYDRFFHQALNKERKPVLQARSLA